MDALPCITSKRACRAHQQPTPGVPRSLARFPLGCRQDQKEGRDASELLSADLARLAPPTNTLFFGLVGASLKLRGALFAHVLAFVLCLCCWRCRRRCCCSCILVPLP